MDISPELKDEFREALNLEGDFWLKLTIKEGNIVAKPVASKVKKFNKLEWRNKLLSLKTEWFGEKEIKEIHKNRIDLEKRISKNTI